MPAQVLMIINPTLASRGHHSGARLGEYTFAAGVLDGLPPRDRANEADFVPFFGFSIRMENTETGSNGLVVHAEHIGQISTR
eukprot:4825526-Alexandrium_andersonii.AAC.1